jgi:hypothetical protein
MRYVACVASSHRSTGGIAQVRHYSFALTALMFDTSGVMSITVAKSWSTDRILMQALSHAAMAPVAQLGPADQDQDQGLVDDERKFDAQ